MTEPIAIASAEQRGRGDTLTSDTTTPDHPPFAPVFTLVTNTSSQTTHHPHVRYIFSDDGPDVLTQALADHDPGLDDSSDDPTSVNHRAVILDLARNPDGAYHVSWASSLSPSWAVLNAQLNQTSPPSSDGGGGGNDNEGPDDHARPKRLMLRIEGIESGSTGSEGELRISGEASRQGSASNSGSGSAQKERERTDGEDYGSMVDEFERRMALLRKLVDDGEERRRKVAAVSATPEETAPSSKGGDDGVSGA
jgi:hypothetical protein